MSKHTPGPWIQDKYGNIKTPSGQMLVTDGVALGGYSTNESRGNARLISAAPELLQALNKIMRIFPTGLDMAEAGWDIDYINKALEAKDIASKAIGKATGETK